MARAAAFDPDFGTATQALAALRRGAISSRELTAHVLARIDKVNPALNCFVTVMRDEALAAARRADAQRGKSRGKAARLGPLHGLPVVAKDTYATKGVRTTAGSKLLEQHVPSEDAVVVARLKAAGAVIVGKTNTPEWAGDWQSFNEVAGQSNNPWDLSRTPGGSTGGGAAALAAGLGFLEVGSDIAGSIRIPSHFCGIYGHKPTWNLVPMRGHIPPLPGMGGHLFRAAGGGADGPQRRGSRCSSWACSRGQTIPTRWPTPIAFPRRAARSSATTASATCSTIPPIPSTRR